MSKVNDLAVQVSKKVANVLVVTSVLLMTNVAFAADPTIGGADIGAVAQKLTTEATSGKNLLWALAQIVGIGLAMKGITMYVNINKGKGGDRSIGHAAGVFVIGSLMFFLPIAMQVGATSLLT